MTGPVVNTTKIPTGGGVVLNIPTYLQPPPGTGDTTISRAVYGSTGLSSFTQLYSGVPLFTWIDVGDLLPGPLLSGASYVWQVSDGNGTTQTGPVVPASILQTRPDALTQLMLRLLQAGVDGLSGSRPAGVNGILVSTAMPQGGLRSLPLLILNLDLIQQEETQIGQDIDNPDGSNVWTIWVNAKRVWRVSIFGRNPTERDFYRDSVIAMWQVWHSSVFAPIGLNVSHRFQAASGTDVSESEGLSPGFYYADIMLELDGVFDVAVLDSFGIIATLDTTLTLQPGGITTVVTAGP
jgi:hypothetical protein